ncbi:uncharacterized protein AC631_00401 [Debaryomyces fabryi]|uniref:Uncharacterized protein n=1 Tax=Debaryomyces fabryi TaxID=58627 RepID=A0A0V1Q5W1_9ASCO|nr:uncharacterized protein AC631_00401 [Debaryomyces fabryi]KSA03766.1 hypothetical protein AC631_00401 [Debaryomyces fabryi]CUM45284.1 unnamed protein product [Debaryomyces fabryi]
MASVADLVTSLPRAAEFNDFGTIKEKILSISPQMFDSKLNETQNIINNIQSLVDILINECPDTVSDNIEFMISFKLNILEFKEYINTFRQNYNKLSSDFGYYMESELLLSQEKLINENCQSEKDSRFYRYSRPSERFPWNFKLDLENLVYPSEIFQKIKRDLIMGVNALRRNENIYEIKVVTNKFGYLTISN